MNYERLGSKIAGWWVDTSLLKPDSIVYSFGLGLDVTFELELIKKIGCTVHGFDPTPGETHKFLATVKEPKFIIHEVGLAAVDRKTVFAPLAPGWGTYTEYADLVIKQGDPKLASTVQLKCLASLLTELKHDHLDVLKIDIEGSEYEVITDLFETHKAATVPIKQLLVEWHKAPKGVDHTYALIYLQYAGFSLGYAEGINFSYVRG